MNYTAAGRQYKNNFYGNCFGKNIPTILNELCFEIPEIIFYNQKIMILWKNNKQKTHGLNGSMDIFHSQYSL